MARNVEIKARLHDRESCLMRAEQLTGEPPKIIHQEDVFFQCASGRLKLRILSPQEGELIFYQRPDAAGPKTSHYSIVRINKPSELRKLLAGAYGIRAVVRKTRHLFVSGRSRIHLDSVYTLGDFLELEVVLSESEDVSSGENEARSLMQALNVEESSLIDVAYIDLIEDGMNNPVIKPTSASTPTPARF